MLMQLNIVPTDNMIQEKQKKELPLLHEGNTEIFTNRPPFPVLFGCLNYALCELQHQPNPSCHKRWQTVSNDPKQPKANDKHPMYKESPTYSVNTIQCPRFVELVTHAITSRKCLYV